MVTFAEDQLDRTFAALAHPIRRSILGRLATRGAASVSDLAEPFDVSLMAISKHVRVMEEAGFIRRERDGRVKRCSYDPAAFDAASAWIDRHRAFWNQQLDSLAEYIEGAASAANTPSEAEPTTPRGGER